MNQIKLFLTSALFCFSLMAGAEESPVDVFIGSAGLGHVTPAAASPFGMVQAGPDTSAKQEYFAGDWPHTGGYQHTDGWLWRFSQTHISAKRWFFSDAPTTTLQ